MNNTNKKTNIQIDWLQVYCKGILIKHDFFQFKLLSINTRIFRTIYEVKKQKTLIATIAMNPFSGILSADSMIIKIDNKYLYQNNAIELIYEFIGYLNVKIIGITRLDLAIDFNEFDNRLKAQNLIDGFLKDKYLKMGNANYKLIGKQTTFHKYSYLRFGSNISTVSAYLYDKTKEMNEVKMKQYIFEQWITAGLDVKKPVWRLEFSYKGNQLKILDKDTGEIENISANNLKIPNILNKLFFSTVNKYFNFKINDGNKNKSRMKSVKLFEETLKNNWIIKQTDLKDSVRSDKIFIKKMEIYNNEIRQTRLADSFIFDELINKFVEDRRLQGAHRKILQDIA